MFCTRINFPFQSILKHSCEAENPRGHRVRAFYWLLGNCPSLATGWIISGLSDVFGFLFSNSPATRLALQYTLQSSLPQKLRAEKRALGTAQPHGLCRLCCAAAPRCSGFLNSYAGKDFLISSSSCPTPSSLLPFMSVKRRKGGKKRAEIKKQTQELIKTWQIILIWYTRQNKRVLWDGKSTEHSHLLPTALRPMFLCAAFLHFLMPLNTPHTSANTSWSIPFQIYANQQQRGEASLNSIK